MKAVSFDELRERYQGADETFIEVHSRGRAREFMESKAASSWGSGPVGATGWHMLGRGSPVRKGGKATVFVCLSSLLDNQKEKE